MFTPGFRISGLSFLVLLAFTSLTAFADSHVRIVRLSYIEGGVQVSRPDSQGYDKAMTNLPVTEGMKLKTSDDGKAEVEFEDGSTLRVVPDSIVEFAKLSLQDSGNKVSAIEVVEGTAYLNFNGSKDDEFTVAFAGQKATLAHAAHFRIDRGLESASIAVFKGELQIEAPSGPVEVKKNQTVAFSASNDGQYKLAKSVADEPWDEWDDRQNEYHTRYAMKSYNSYSPYAYGTSDLTYYGSFFNYPGYGMMWQPYFAGIGWDPFMDGAWAYYPGFGYGWVSSYPWGWTPYHYGSWVFIPNRGWAWQPGGVWHPVYTQPVLVNAPKTFTPPRAPVGGSRMVVVNRGTASTFSGDRLVLRNNSAGLGVPRGEIHNLSKVSQKVEMKGVVNQRVSMPPAAMSSGSRQMGHPAAGMGGMQRNSAPRSGGPASAPSSRGASSMPSAHSAPSMPSSHSAGPPPFGGPSRR